MHLRAGFFVSSPCQCLMHAIPSLQDSAISFPSPHCHQRRLKQRIMSEEADSISNSIDQKSLLQLLNISLVHSYFTPAPLPVTEDDSLLSPRPKSSRHAPACSCGSLTFWWFAPPAPTALFGGGGGRPSRRGGGGGVRGTPEALTLSTSVRTGRLVKHC